MKNRRVQGAQCLVFAAFGAAALLPLPAHAEETKPCGAKADAPIATTPEGEIVLPPAVSGTKQEGLANEVVCARAKPPTVINPRFRMNLYEQLRKREGNVLFSPYSISEALAMAHAGAKGKTAIEIAHAMAYRGDRQELTGCLRSLRQHVIQAANQGDDKLRIANALCVTGEVPRQSYQDLVRKQFDGELFAGGLPEINSWVEKQTDGNIEKILEQLSPDSACVLLNAVYFKGTWRDSFKEHSTRKGKFHLTPTHSVKVPMMTRIGHYPVVYNHQHLAVELPYKTSCSMVLLMPRKAEDFTKFEAGLSEAFVSGICKELRGGQREIQLSIPKFKIETEYDLIKPMKRLGMLKAFSQVGADFSGMYDIAKLKSDNIYIGQIVHRATLEVDEQGSVATAATALTTLRELSAPKPPELKIDFDRPFILLIRENTTNTTLFAGRISDPSKRGAMLRTH